MVSADMGSTKSWYSREETYASTLFNSIPSLSLYLSTISTTRVACLWCRVLPCNLMLGTEYLYIVGLVVCARSWGLFGRIFRLQRTGRTRNCQCVGHAVILNSMSDPKSPVFGFRQQSLIINQYQQYRSLTQTRRSRKSFWMCGRLTHWSQRLFNRISQQDIVSVCFVLFLRLRLQGALVLRWPNVKPSPGNSNSAFSNDRENVDDENLLLAGSKIENAFIVRVMY